MSYNGFAIGEYLDAAEVTRQLDKLIKKPVYSVRPDKLKEMAHMGAAYMAEGIVPLTGSRLYTSAAYTEEMIGDVLTRFDRVFANCGKVGKR